MADVGDGRPPDWRPVPDPTALTTEALNREIDRLRSSFEAARDAMHTLLSERIDAIVSLMDEKLRRVDQQFDLVERQRIEQKEDTKAAVDAALTAQKEAVKEQTIASERAIAKSETATTKQAEQQSNTFATAIESLRRAIDDNKDRLVVIESRVIAIEQQRIGSRETLGEHRESNTALIAIVGLVLTVIIIAVSIYLGTRPR